MADIVEETKAEIETLKRRHGLAETIMVTDIFLSGVASGARHNAEQGLYDVEKLRKALEES